ncbi:putative manganese-dependent inorganic diphosphatase [Clostridium algidicarnis]|uniref:inorganic diphosphatase n=1 Tax=Clostridium algidicarnis DSM 15099 TaxID=1121295 RepID=A0A2S6G178_9CLOT|nr:putative manganese-dependent inorganic diphosphatase [Clostridium algidicarnis]MBB6696387.1 putative manganese-dependent inorganic diphosphatase [Clostridium algidicarnis]MBU3193606.1 putative manganese-dependent inorganic diphosphatase [Clostridium algidicarnis]MBU3202988.1 putative manganese-dependent inorganic diphosphatase [Clostridium algidicarnis]MBU3205713.1 putative manganese-dependent inorganic diphosphatase [Clostridium algidicarnis]MBU3211142.1 putative manganese-dependent inorga
MKDVIYISGHKNPDSDSICAAIAYAEFKNRTEDTEAVPVRLGELNRETKFILDYFEVESPKLIETVKLQVSDLNIDKIAPISPDISLKMAWNIMKKHNLKTLPVTDENEYLKGIVSVSNLTSTFMDVWDTNILSKSNTKLENILETLSAKPIFIYKGSTSFKGKIIVTAMKPESIQCLIEEGDIAIVGDREDNQLISINAKSSLVIVTGTQEVSDAVIKKAEENGCTLISTSYDSFTAARLITQSIPVEYVMAKDNIINFSTEDFVDDIRDVMIETRYRSYPVVNIENRIIGSISRYHLISRNKKKVILLDHNERGQSVDGLEDAEVLEIIDHHRIADVQTGTPIYFRNEPVGSTSTIIGSIFFENGIRPSKKVAGILCAAIISDTLLFKSPTATNVDKMILKRLAQIADLDVETFAKEMFKAGTSLIDRTAEDVFHQDFKIFNLGNMKIGVSQINTMDIESFLPIKADMINLMEAKAVKENFNILIFMLTDILNVGSEIMASGPSKDMVSKAFNIKLNNKESVFLPGILSRKKQVIPPLSTAITMVK